MQPWQPPPPPRPPLPPGWTQHTGPQGQIYFYHAASGQSSYTLPTGTMPVYSHPPPPTPPSTTTAAAAQPPPKEKPATKTPIPGADGWLRVTTNLGNVFYSYPATKRSEWSVPDEIRHAVDALEEQERLQKRRQEEEKKAREEQEAQRRRREEEDKRRQEDERQAQERQERERKQRALEEARKEQQRRLKELDELGKRKRGEALDDDEDGAGEGGATGAPGSGHPRGPGGQGAGSIDADELLARPASPKRARTEGETRGSGDEEDGGSAGPGSGRDDQDEDGDEDEAAWQRRMAEEMAAEAEAASDEEKQAAAVPQTAAVAAGVPAVVAGAPAAVPAVVPHYSGPPPSIPPPPPGGFHYPPPPLPAPPVVARPPPPPNLTHEEALPLFKRMLSSLNATASEVNPMAPWDRELPKFVHLPEYGLLPSLRDRQDAFNEWCKERLREKRMLAKLGKQQDGGGAGAGNTTAGSKEFPAAPRAASQQAGGPDPPATSSSTSSSSSTSPAALAAYRALLAREVTSTRARYDDFRRDHRRSREFFGFGRDERAREREFKRHVRELGERKRREMEEREEAFLALVEGTVEAEAGGLEALRRKWKVDDRVVQGEEEAAAATQESKAREAWAEVKKLGGMERDARYDAVGSSSRRAELFASWLRGTRRAKGKADAEDSRGQRGARNGSAEGNGAGGSAGARGESEEDAQRRALRAREEKVRNEMGRVQSQNRRALGAAKHDESTIHFTQLLIDRVKNPLLEWREARRQLAPEPRFAAPGVSEAEKERLFDEHVARLTSQRRRAVRSLFEKHAGGRLDVGAEVVVPLVREDDDWEAKGVKRWVESVAAAERRAGSGRAAAPPSAADEEEGASTVSPASIDAVLRREFETWDEERQKSARDEFGALLRENSFVSFWGQLRAERRRRSAEEGGGAVGQLERQLADDEGEADDEPSLLQMASTIDLDEVHSVLRNDRRYRAFQHVPEKREAWIREFLSTMSVPKQTVHQQQAGSTRTVA